MIRKYYALWCDVKGCQFHITPMRTRAGVRQVAIDNGWQLYRDFRKKERARCLRHAKALE